ncbi:MAG: phosphodiester glycosidase family protein [Planctomycetota bacterium]
MAAEISVVRAGFQSTWFIPFFCQMISISHPMDAKGADWSPARELYPGIQLLQEKRAEPRNVTISCVRIDLQTPGLRLHTTGRARSWERNATETIRQSTREFIRLSAATNRRIVFAANADAFSPWPAPWNKPTPTDLNGLAVSDGIVVSPPSGSPSLLIRKDGTASIQKTDPEFSTEDIQTAVSGFAFCLIDAQPQPSGTDLHPRTGLGLSADARYLLIMAVDGRRHSSRGATTHELGRWLLEYGADDAINMDGGGSTTLAWWNSSSDRDDKCELINTPVGNGMKFESELADQAYVPTERLNGNNIGVYYLSP